MNHTHHRAHKLESYLGCLILVSLFLSPAGLMAQTPKTTPEKRPPIKATFEQKVDVPQPLKVGQPFTVTFIIEHPANAKVIMPEQAPSAWWSILSSKQQPLGESSTKTQVKMTLVPWRSGSKTIAALPLTVQNAEGQSITLKSKAFDIKPLTTLPVKTKEPDLKKAQKPVKIMIEDKSPLWIGLGFLGFGVLAFALFFFMRRRLDKVQVIHAPRDPHVIALERLGQLAASDDIERGEFLDFYTKMSEVIREYLGRQFEFPGTELTTTEMEDRLNTEDWPQGLSVRDIIQWLYEGDRIKFTEDQPTQSSAEASLRQAFSIVELTRHHQDILQEQALKAQNEALAKTNASSDDVKPSADTLSAKTAVTHTTSKANEETTSEEMVETPDEIVEEPELPTPTSDGFDAWAAILDAAEEDEEIKEVDEVKDREPPSTHIADTQPKEETVNPVEEDKEHGHND